LSYAAIPVLGVQRYKTSLTFTNPFKKKLNLPL